MKSGHVEKKMLGRLRGLSGARAVGMPLRLSFFGSTSDIVSPIGKGEIEF